MCKNSFLDCPGFYSRGLRRRQSMQPGTLRKIIVLLGFAISLTYIAGCKKHVATAPPAPPPAPAAQPTVTLNASPSSVQPGQTVTLAWSSTSATDLDIEPGVGKVAPQGS